jgi:hypothetical protein
VEPGVDQLGEDGAVLGRVCVVDDVLHGSRDRVRVPADRGAVRVEHAAAFHDGVRERVRLDAERRFLAPLEAAEAEVLLGALRKLTGEPGR